MELEDFFTYKKLIFSSQWSSLTACVFFIEKMYFVHKWTAIDLCMTKFLSSIFLWSSVEKCFKLLWLKSFEFLPSCEGNIMKVGKKSLSHLLWPTLILIPTTPQKWSTRSGILTLSDFTPSSDRPFRLRMVVVLKSSIIGRHVSLFGLPFLDTMGPHQKVVWRKSKCPSQPYTALTTAIPHRSYTGKRNNEASILLHLNSGQP